MRARFLIENPDEVEASMTITMTIKQWTEMLSQLNRKWPSSWLSTAISGMLVEARRVYYANDQDPLG